MQCRRAIGRFTLCPVGKSTERKVTKGQIRTRISVKLNTSKEADVKLASKRPQLRQKEKTTERALANKQISCVYGTIAQQEKQQEKGIRRIELRIVLHKVEQYIAWWCNYILPQAKQRHFKFPIAQAKLKRSGFLNEVAAR